MLLGLPKYLLHIRKRGGYRERFATRFGRGLRLPPKGAGKRRVWLQAVSLGEMLAIEPLLKGLAADPQVEIFLTTTTSTGYALARERYGALAVEIAYFPVDFWPFSRRVWELGQPDLAVCAETELWPEHIEQARRRGVPFVLVNARLSDRSFGRLRRVAGLTRSVWRGVSMVYAGSEQDRERFLALGVAPERVATTGNVKVDVVIEPRLDAAGKLALRVDLGCKGGFVLLGSSTWPGEESMLLRAFRRVRERDERATLLLVPRHAERRGEIEALLRAEAGELSWHFRSRGRPSEPVDIVVADTNGELRALTQVADLAFVGKSLPPHREGQTPVECGALGLAMVFGPGMSNFRSISAGLLEFGAALVVADAGSAVEAIAALSSDAAERGRMGEAGQRWHAASRGAVGRTLEGLRGWLGGGR